VRGLTQVGEMAATAGNAAAGSQARFRINRVDAGTNGARFNRLRLNGEASEGLH